MGAPFAIGTPDSTHMTREVTVEDEASDSRLHRGCTMPVHSILRHDQRTDRPTRRDDEAEPDGMKHALGERADEEDLIAGGIVAKGLERAPVVTEFAVIIVFDDDCAG